jgi:hypothetical protein
MTTAPASLQNSSLLSAEELAMVTQAFQHEGASVRASFRHLMQNKDAISAALLLSLSFLRGQTLDQVLIEDLFKVEPAQFNQNLINFQIQCSINGGILAVGIAVLQEQNSQEVCQILNRLLLYKDFGLNRLCILRSAASIENTPEIQTYLPRLLSPEIGGSFVDLQVGALTALLTVLYVFRGRRKYLISVSQLVRYLEQEGILMRNPILRDLMMTVQM